MPIQREWHYIDRQADHEAGCGPNTTPCSLIVFDRAYAAYYCTIVTTMGKTIDSMLRAIFKVPWSLKHPCCICSLPIAVVGTGLVQDLKLLTSLARPGPIALLPDRN